MDHKRFAYQTANLDTRIKTAVVAVAQKFGIDASGFDATWSRDDMTRKLNEQTALAEFLEALAEVKPASKTKKAE